MNQTRSIVFGGLLAAIHIIAVLVIEFIPGIDLILIFALPFLSVMYVIQCKPVYVISYAVSTLVLSIVFNPTIGLLYILPTLMAGIVYGYLVKQKTTTLTLIYALTAVQLLTFFLSIQLIEWIYAIDLVSSLQTFFHLDLDANQYLGLPLLVLYCFSQAFLLHIILKGQLKRFRIRFEKTPFPPLWIAIVEALLILAMFSSLIKDSHILAVTIGSIVFGIPFVLYVFQKSKRPHILFLVAAVCFLVIALPLTRVYKEASSGIPFIAMFVPLILYGMWLAIKESNYFKV